MGRWFFPLESVTCSSSWGEGDFNVRIVTCCVGWCWIVCNHGLQSWTAIMMGRGGLFDDFISQREIKGEGGRPHIRRPRMVGQWYLRVVQARTPRDGRVEERKTRVPGQTSPHALFYSTALLYFSTLVHSATLYCCYAVYYRTASSLILIARMR